MKSKEVEKRCFISDMKIEQRDGESASRTISGYAAKFDSWSSRIGGWFREIIARGAFDNCDLSDVIMCFNHNTDNILARSSSETLTITADEVGLKFSFDAPQTTQGNDMLELVSRGDISKCSFAFTTESDSWNYESNKEGLAERTITKFKKIYDCALVVHPAYEDTEVGVRNLEQRKLEYLNSQDNGSSSRDRLCQTLKLKTNI